MRNSILLPEGFPGEFIQIPLSLYCNNDLSLIEVFVLNEIISLDEKDGCFASNKHFADLLGISIRRVQQIIFNLTDNGYISVKVEYNSITKEVEKRTIYPNAKKIFVKPTFKEKKASASDEKSQKGQNVTSKKDKMSLLNQQDDRSTMTDCHSSQGVEEKFHPLTKNISLPHEENFVTPTKEISSGHEENFTTPHEENFVYSNNNIENNKKDSNREEHIDNNLLSCQPNYIQELEPEKKSTDQQMFDMLIDILQTEGVNRFLALLNRFTDEKLKEMPYDQLHMADDYITEGTEEWEIFENICCRWSMSGMKENDIIPTETVEDDIPFFNR